jgi:hypothetical protein
VTQLQRAAAMRAGVTMVAMRLQRAAAMPAGVTMLTMRLQRAAAMRAGVTMAVMRLPTSGPVPRAMPHAQTRASIWRVIRATAGSAATRVRLGRIKSRAVSQGPASRSARRATWTAPTPASRARRTSMPTQPTVALADMRARSTRYALTGVACAWALPSRARASASTSGGIPKIAALVGTVVSVARAWAAYASP